MSRTLLGITGEGSIFGCSNRSIHSSGQTHKEGKGSTLGSLAYLLARFSTARFPPLCRFHGWSGFGRMDRNDKKDGVMKHSSSALAEGLETGHTGEIRRTATTRFEPTETKAKRQNQLESDHTANEAKVLLVKPYLRYLHSRGALSNCLPECMSHSSTELVGAHTAPGQGVLSTSPALLQKLCSAAASSAQAPPSLDKVSI